MKSEKGLFLIAFSALAGSLLFPSPAQAQVDPMTALETAMAENESMTDESRQIYRGILESLMADDTVQVPLGEMSQNRKERLFRALRGGVKDFPSGAYGTSLQREAARELFEMNLRTCFTIPVFQPYGDLTRRDAQLEALASALVKSVEAQYEPVVDEEVLQHVDPIIRSLFQKRVEDDADPSLKGPLPEDLYSDFLARAEALADAPRMDHFLGQGRDQLERSVDPGSDEAQALSICREARRLFLRIADQSGDIALEGPYAGLEDTLAYSRSPLQRQAAEEASEISAQLQAAEEAQRQVRKEAEAAAKDLALPDITLPEE